MRPSAAPIRPLAANSSPCSKYERAGFNRDGDGCSRYKAVIAAMTMNMQYTRSVLSRVMALAFGLALTAAGAASPEAQALFKDGIALREKGDLPGALAVLRRAAQLDPSLPHIRREIGLILIEQRDFSGAAVELHQVIRADPADFQSRYNLALALANAGQVQEALQEAGLLVQLKPRWALAFYGLGHIHALAGDADNAMQAFRTSLSLNPKYYRAWFEMGKLLAGRGDHNGAIQAFASAVRLQPNSAAARYRLAVLLQKTGRTAAAAQEFAAARNVQAERGKGERAAAAYRLGIERLEKGDYSGAAAALEQAKGQRPDFDEIHSMLAEVHEQWGADLESRSDLDGALSHYQRAVALAASPETLNHVGVLLARTGRLDAAIESFRGALRLDSGFAKADKNLRKALALKAQR
jgi:tetratricopeptide (TPR) repeat protein